MNIGLLEDNPSTQEWMVIALEFLGHKVYTHTTGASLLEVFFPVPETTLLAYDLLIADLNLPGGITGQEVVTRLRSNASTERLPILIISGTGEHEIVHVQEQFPSIPVLHKPFRLQALTQFIDQCAKTILTGENIAHRKAWT
ncbi:MAG: hypothetical protein NVSMB27_17350 [Ktedonobacteraceae bacterium]